jgi:hypothetical protein
MGFLLSTDVTRRPLDFIKSSSNTSSSSLSYFILIGMDFLVSSNSDSSASGAASLIGVYEGGTCFANCYWDFMMLSISTGGGGYVTTSLI